MDDNITAAFPYKRMLGRTLKRFVLLREIVLALRRKQADWDGRVTSERGTLCGLLSRVASKTKETAGGRRQRRQVFVFVTRRVEICYF